jgi:L,D-peptidoglycan transpeptidase YkuD (ErfK/YbiS/YcfS/YnhG family)
MAGARHFQRGHASLTPNLRGSGLATLRPPGHGRRKALVLGGAAAVLVLASAAAGLWWRGQAELATTPDQQAAPAQADSPSLIDTAMARVQETARGLSQSTGPTSGLIRTPLSDPALDQVKPLLGRAEARLIGIYQLIGQGKHREALAAADALVRDHPNFQLAHLVHGDLLSLQTRPVRQLGDVPDTTAQAAAEQLATLREESRRRLRALTERPPEGHVPSQFLTLSTQSRHAIAVDASRSRLYLFENQTPPGENGKAAPARLKLIGDYYISVGLQGIEKQLEGDKRTPLGVYYITSTLDPKSLPDLYGVGALPINYPNALDAQRGKTGSGIWLHGTPREQFVRAPQASDGCVVLANPDLERLLSTVQVRTTPVVIAPELQWVAPQHLDAERDRFETELEAWRQARSQGQLERLRGFYSERFNNQGRDLSAWWPRVESELRSAGSRELELKDLSLLRWRDSQDTMVVTFGEVPAGQTRGVTRRQYWSHENGQWKIFFEGTL